MSDSSSIESFYVQVQAAFVRASALAGSTQSFNFCIADRVMRLTFAGTTLIEPFTRALQHLKLDHTDHVDIEIRLWDIAGTGAQLPPPPWGNEAYSKRGEVLGFCDARLASTFRTDGVVLSLYDSKEQLGTVTVFDVADLPVYERVAPLNPILYPALAALNLQYTHAGAVGLPEGGVILAGKAGAGKSTTALACLASDLLFAGDDYCAVSTGPEPIAYSLYSTAKADAGTIARLAFLRPHVQLHETIPSERAVWFLNEAFPQKMISKFPIRAILLPRVTNDRVTRLVPASPAAAVAALAPNTISQLPNAGGDVLQRLTALAHRLPAWYLDVGTNMHQIPDTILELLKTLNLQAQDA